MLSDGAREGGAEESPSAALSDCVPLRALRGLNALQVADLGRIIGQRSLSELGRDCVAQRHPKERQHSMSREPTRPQLAWGDARQFVWTWASGLKSIIAGTVLVEACGLPTQVKE